MSEPAHLLDVRNLSVEFRTSRTVVHATRNVSFHLDRGETLAVLGESGSGKSVTAAAIMGLIDVPPGHISSGEAFFDGVDLMKMSRSQRNAINGRRISMIFQDPLAALNPVYSLGWQIAEAMRTHGIARGEEHATAVALLDRVGIPNARQRINDYPHQFSGGQRQRAMIAMAIATKPDILIGDEPTSALDVTVQAQILKLLAELRAETGMGLLIITHDLGVAAEVADRVVVMHNGEVVETGATDAVLHNPQHAYTKRLVSAVSRGVSVGKIDAAAVPLIEARNLVRIFPARNSFSGSVEKVVALDDVSFAMQKGESIGIIGESGSGKTTLARLLVNLDEATSGEVLFKGRPIRKFGRSDRLAFRRGVQMVFQDPTSSLNPYMSVAQIVAEPWTVHRDVMPRERWHSRTLQLLDAVGLSAKSIDRYPHQFSGGQRQRIAIARALALEPEVIICDEAVSALDRSIQAQILDLLKQLRTEFNLSYLFIAHDLSVVRNFTDRVIVMYKGKAVEIRPTTDLFANPIDPYTRELLAASRTFDLTELDAVSQAAAAPAELT